MNIVGVDVGCTKMHLTAKVNGAYVDRRARTGLDCKVEHIKQEIDAFTADLPYEIDGIGIAVPGLVDGDSVVKYSDVHNLNGVTVEYFTEGKVAGRLINDVRAATWAEIANYADNQTMAVIMCGTGIAVGLATNGEIHLGGSGYAGELGYCILSEIDGKPQTVDDLAGGAGILRRAGCDVGELLDRIESGQPDARQLIRNAGRYFGYTLTNIMHLYNPDIIVVGGSTSTYDGYMEEALATAEKNTLKDIFDSCQITRAKDNKRIVALGAIAFTARKLADS